ncbi:hypothetical protein HYX04_04405 [Candidatus Woesearchaeota archaeon]|nr:hypothetical protein [Candidatus Woesearchaeota archaeon]
MFNNAYESVHDLERILRHSKYYKDTRRKIGYLRGFLDALRDTVAAVPQPYAGMISQLGQETDTIIGSKTHRGHPSSKRNIHRLKSQEIYDYLIQHEGKVVTAADIYLSVSGEPLPLSEGNILLMRERIRPHIYRLKRNLSLRERIISYQGGRYKYASK